MLLWLDECAHVIYFSSNIKEIVDSISNDFYSSGIGEVEYTLSLKGRLLDGVGSEKQTNQVYA